MNSNLINIINNLDTNCFKSINTLVSILHTLIMQQKLDVIRHYLSILEDKKILVNIINQYNKYGNTALHLAVKNNYQDIAKLLIEFGANKDFVDNKGQKVVWVHEQKGGFNKKILGKRYT